MTTWPTIAGVMMTFTGRRLSPGARRIGARRGTAGA
jgi:hypothetical protein